MNCWDNTISAFSLNSKKLKRWKRTFKENFLRNLYNNNRKLLFQIIMRARSDEESRKGFNISDFDS